MGLDTQGYFRKLKEAKAQREASGQKISEHIQPVLQSTSKPKRTLKQIIMAPIVTSVIRHLITLAGGGLIAEGSVSDNEINILVGALATIASVGWSVWKSHKQKQKEAK